MNLVDFLSTAMARGHARVRVTSTARGHEIHRGELASATAEHLEALCRDDAFALPREALHEYVVTVESEDASKASRHSVRVHGAAGPVGDHQVDPREVTNAGQALGHLVRLVVDQHKHFVQLASRLIDKDETETKELGRLRRGLARRGEHEVSARALELEAAERSSERERASQLWGRLLTMGEPLVARLLPGGVGEASALQSVRSSLSDSQLGELAELLGPVRFGKFLALDSPEKVATLFIDQVSADLGKVVFGLLNEKQRHLIGVAMKPEMMRRTAAAEKAAAASSTSAPTPAPAPNGAPL